jgi:predicted RNase H-like HicB family nuclease
MLKYVGENETGNSVYTAEINSVFTARITAPASELSGDYVVEICDGVGPFTGQTVNTPEEAEQLVEQIISIINGE